MRFLGLSILLVFALGCPSTAEPPVPTTCSKRGDKCKLVKGQLGVCVEIGCNPGDAPPCMRCMPQH